MSSTSASAGARAAATAVDLAVFYAPYLVSLSETAPPPARVAGAFAALAMLAAQAALLARDGQTVGKKMWRLRVVRRDTGENGGFATNVLIRAVAAWTPNLLLVALGSPPLWLAADALTLWWRGDGLSLHDLIAGTAVVDCP